MTANRKSAVAAPREIAIVVFGHDAARKPHASTFTTDQAELAEKAAVLMGMRLLRVGTDDQRALAAKLPNGKIFASGKALVPEVRPALFAKLIALVDPENASHATQRHSFDQHRQQGPFRRKPGIRFAERRRYGLADHRPRQHRHRQRSRN